MNTRAAGRGTTTAGIAVTTDAVTTVAAAGERGRQGTRRGVIYQPGYTLTKSATFPENRTTSVSRLLTGSSTVPFHRGGRCFVRLPVSRSLTGSSTVPVHREGGSRQRMSGPSTMSHPALWTCPACGRPLTVALNPEGGEAGAHRPLEISRASAAAHACTPAARFPQFHSASSSSSITGYEPASCQPWQPPVSAGAEDDEGVISQSEYTLTKPSSCPNHWRTSSSSTSWTELRADADFGLEVADGGGGRLVLRLAGRGYRGLADVRRRRHLPPAGRPLDERGLAAGRPEAELPIAAAAVLDARSRHPLILPRPRLVEEAAAAAWTAYLVEMSDPVGWQERQRRRAYLLGEHFAVAVRSVEPATLARSAETDEDRGLWDARLLELDGWARRGRGGSRKRHKGGE